MPKFVIQPSAAPFLHDGQPHAAGDTIELTMEQAAKKIARGDLKLAGKAVKPDAKPDAKPGE